MFVITKLSKKFYVVLDNFCLTRTMMSTAIKPRTYVLASQAPSVKS